jgi:hypothetical protein
MDHLGGCHCGNIHVRLRAHSDRYDYGFLPPRFFNQVIEAFADWYRTGRRRVTPRE